MFREADEKPAEWDGLSLLSVTSLDKKDCYNRTRAKLDMVT